MNRWLTGAAASALLAACVLSFHASAADDRKMFHGSDCQVFGATAWTDLAFSGYGVKNLATSARNVICPLIKDSESFWDGENFPATPITNYGFVHLHIETGGVAASYACTVYVTSVWNSTQAKSYAVSSGGVAAANTNYSHDTLGSFQSTPASVTAAAPDHDKAYMLCTLGPSVRLMGYFLHESAATDL